MKSLENQGVESRLAFIELLLYLKGWLSRADLMARFGLKEAAATRDLRAYRDKAEENLYLNHKERRYEINEKTFSPLSNINSRKILSSLKSEKISRSIGFESCGVTPIPRLSYPDDKVISMISRAILNEIPVAVDYLSLANGSSRKILFPHSMFDNGIKVYTRAFDFEKKKFIELALDRMVEVTPHDVDDVSMAKRDVDLEWNKVINLRLVPNKKTVKNVATVEFEMGMTNGFKDVKVRAALAPYWLNRWNVDCSENGDLGQPYQLYLENREVLNEIGDKKIIPGWEG